MSANEIELHSGEREASIRPSDVLSNRLLKCLNIFTNFGMNGLHITGFTGPYTAAEAKMPRSGPSSHSLSRKPQSTAIDTIGCEFQHNCSLEIR